MRTHPRVLSYGSFISLVAKSEAVQISEILMRISLCACKSSRVYEIRKEHAGIMRYMLFLLIKPVILYGSTPDRGNGCGSGDLNGTFCEGESSGGRGAARKRTNCLR